MANAKTFYASFPTGNTIYGIIRRLSDGYLLNDADGAFANTPADPYISFTEDSTIKSLYSLSESRAAWDDGSYRCYMYKQAGGSPAPVSDLLVGIQYMYTKSDTEVVVENEVDVGAVKGIGVTSVDDFKADVSGIEAVTERLLGLVMENHVEDDIVRNDDDYKTSSKIYLYNSRANALSHDKTTGLTASYSVAVTYDVDKNISLFSVVKDV